MVDPLLALGTAVFIILILAFIFWPEKGAFARWKRNSHNTERVLSEDALKHIHKFEMEGRRPTLESISGALHTSQNDTAALIAAMQTNGLLQTKDGEYHLTPKGRDSALHIIRAHRLWERYLAEETGIHQAEWHGQAELAEHQLTPEQADALALQLGNPTHDPHGDPIPTADGEMVTHGGQPLSTLEVDKPGLIVHLEDEPPVVYAQLAAEGLHPGMVVRVTESAPERVRFWTNGDEHIVAPIVADNISVIPLPEEEAEEADDCERLTCLSPGETAEVIGITYASRGPERRRFMDLGILPGTKIKAEMRSPGGDPTAYIIRGAMIALRQDQANLIKVKRVEAA
jgi:DtxR family Mn-dependent transcriptional regulator